MSSKLNVDFDDMFAITLNALKLNGAHPYIPRDRKWLLSFIIKHGIFTAVFCIMLYNIYLSIQLQNFSETCRNGTISVIYFVVSYQYGVLLVHQKTILKIINLMKADFKKEMPDDARDIVYLYAKKGRMVCLEWLIVSASTASMFLGKHIFLELYTFVTDEWKLLPMYPLTYPGVIEEYKEQPIVFTLLYILILFYMSYASMMYTAFVPLGPMFMIHATGQLEIVRKRSLELYAQSNVDVTIKIKEIVQHLQYIYGFVELVKDIFQVVYEITLKVTIVALPITIYEVIESFYQEDFSLDYVNIIVATLLYCGDPCYHSDKLMEKSEEVRLAIYSCGWETRYDHGVRKTLLVTLLRTLQPIAIRTIFSPVCLDTFTDVLRQAYALFNLMNAAWS